MKVELRQNLQKKYSVADTTIVYDQYNNVIMVAVNFDENTIICAKRGDPEFNELCKQLRLGPQNFIDIPIPNDPLRDVVWKA